MLSLIRVGICRGLKRMAEGSLSDGVKSSKDGLGALAEKGKSAADAKQVSNSEWRMLLTPEEYHVTRESGTERAFTGKFDANFTQGVYHCVCCGASLFDSEAKFESSCGWPAFFQAKGVEGKDESDANVVRQEDNSHDMMRTEVRCKKCDAHLGHVFSDGPKPTGERFCINSTALDFFSGGKS